eukprot:Protomagalhaensia_wolfi_Nauph_80__1336@NODE_1798_length_1333_cov_35_106646_g1402_i0_p1_GENE_NODE_1798_length_1333_cov_35_106646_g1402_i0NODE_1798_length_1333_cov_35_106646_g1402_i0_p1_ORF_typecomplete_len409_score69_47ubiquitin/PF00240_23/2_7e13Rad60SLD_2/PF13881_6/6_5e08UBA/PF00627_31/2_2e06GerD/PF17898_1/0_00021GerD/PF17898_1/21Ubiquitin_5/PF18037_1/0_00014Rad60SLD/PF11976_8/0_00015DUF2407/PF10302_9/0_00029STI1/PF17830_1/0_021STI1/PF17830_1/12STI1/PF17830_1/2_9e02Ubiquitin_2/PF14560_6/0_035HOI
MKINFKTNGGATAQLDCEPTETLGQVKERLTPVFSLQPGPNNCRLIYKGRILKDTDTLESLKVVEGASMHVVRSHVPPPASTPTPSSNPATSTSASQTTAAASGSTPSPAPQSAASGTQPASGTPPPNPFAAFAGMGAMGGLPGMGGMGGFPGMGGMPPINPQLMQQVLRNPMMQQMMQEMFRNPEALQMVIQSNPMLQSLMNTNPLLRETMSNPEVLRNIFNPSVLQAASQLYDSVPAEGAPAGAVPPAVPDLNSMLGSLGLSAPAGAQASGSTGTSGGAATTGGASGSPPAMPDFSAFLSGLGAPPAGGSGAAGGMPNMMDSLSRIMQDEQVRNQVMGLLNNMGGEGQATGAAAGGDDETRFASELQQLEDMGFVERSSNLRALRRSHGDVNGAISILLEWSSANM